MSEDREKAERFFAVEFNNKAWDLIEKSDRTPEETMEMIDLAHASTLHWNAIGAPINRLRGLYTIAYAHAVADEGDTARRYALEAIRMVEEKTEGLADWDVAFAYDAAGRAELAAGNEEEGNRLRQEAKAAGEAIASEGDRKIFERTWAI